MVCPKCFANLPDSSVYCMECGARLPQEGVSRDTLYLEGSDPEVYPEIARANLLRMQGKWEEAVDTCIAILRRFPNNETAHALLGDIYADQGNLEEALRWYELAADLNPSNPLYRNKIERLTALQRVHESPPPKKVANDLEPTGWAPSQRGWGWFLMGLLGLALLASAFLAGWRISQREAESQAAPGNSTTLQGEIARGGVLPFPPDSQTPPKSESPPSSESSKPESTNLGVEMTFPLLDQSELMVSNALAQRLGYPASRVWAYHHPVHKQWTVRVLLGSGLLSRERVQREALLTGWTALQIDPLRDLPSITVMVLVPRSASNLNEILFVAEVARPPIPMPDPSRLSSTEMNPFLNAPWWNEAIPISP